MKSIIIFLLFILITLNLFSQVFQVDKQKFLLASSTALAADLVNNYADRLIIEKPTLIDLSKLDENDIPFFDRWALQPYSSKLKDLSDYAAYLTIGLTAFYAYDELDWMDNLMVFSQIMITQSAVAKWTKTLTKRYRPFVYDDDVSIEKNRKETASILFIQCILLQCLLHLLMPISIIQSFMGKVFPRLLFFTALL